jgi:colicin import membrane protein
MRFGVVTSAVLHVLVLGAGMVSLSSPKPHDVLDVESLPIDIVPIEEITRVLEGDKQAPLAETPAPKPTTRPTTVPDAQRFGDNSQDTEAPPTPDPKPREVETAALPQASPEPAPRPAPVVEPEPAPAPPAPAPAPAPAAETAPQPAPEPEPEPAPEPEPTPAETTEALDAPLPDSAPRPESRPRPPQTQTASTPERRQPEKPVERQAQKRAEQTSESVLDDVAALLNKEKASGGGAKRSTEQAALGGERKTPGEKLSQSEMDALRQRLGSCWNIPAGAEDGDALRVSVRFRLDRSGKLEGRPEVVQGGASSGAGRIAAESAVRAVQKCEPFNLPADKYETWAEVIVNFDPSDMF